MKDTMTAQSVRATVAYFILQNVWCHLIATGDDAARAIVDRLKTEHMDAQDRASYYAVRGLWLWQMQGDGFSGWSEDLDTDLPEASCEGCGERLSCCQCDGGWNEARERERIGNTPTCEDCGAPQDHCVCPPDVCIVGNPARHGICGDPLCLCANEVAE